MTESEAQMQQAIKRVRSPKRVDDRERMLRSAIVEAGNADAVIELFYMTREPDILRLCRGIAALDEPDWRAVDVMVGRLLQRSRLDGEAEIVRAVSASRPQPDAAFWRDR